MNLAGFLFEFGPFAADPRAGVLIRQGSVIPLPPKAFEVLMCLLRSGGRPLTRETLLAAVWGEAYIEDANLTQAISVLRKALGDECREPRYILTIPRRGYRFGVPILEVPGAESVPDSEDPKPRSIVVLPFANISSDPDNEYFSDGLTEEIINALAPVPGLKVVARTTAFQFKGRNRDVRLIGSQVGAEAVLEGSVRRQGERVRITAQMIQARDGYHFWSRAWDRQLRDIFAVQQEIADAIVLALGATGSVLISAVSDIEAYNLYLRGLYLTNKLAYPEAVEVLEEAVKRDPAFAAANAALGGLHGLLGYESYVRPKEAYAIAARYTNRALELNPTLPSALLSQGWISTFYDRDWTGAERYLKRAIAGNQSVASARHAYAHFLVAMNRIPEALTESRQIVVEEPSNPGLQGHLAWHYLYSGRPEWAIAQAHHALTIDPSLVPNLRYLRWAYEAWGDFEQAIRTAERHFLADDIARLWDAYRARGETGYWETWLERLLAKRKRDYSSPYEIAVTFAQLDRKSEALDWLQCGFDECESWIVYLKVDPKLQSLRTESKFIELVKQLRLP